jgi:hypothetical protein
MKGEKDEYQVSLNKPANNFNSNNIKVLNSLQKQDGKSEISEISPREEITSIYQTDLNEPKRIYLKKK